MTTIGKQPQPQSKKELDIEGMPRFCLPPSDKENLQPNASHTNRALNKTATVSSNN